MEYFPIRRPAFNEENDCTQNLCLFKSIYLANKFFLEIVQKKKDRNNYPEPLSFGSTVHNLVHWIITQNFGFFIRFIMVD